ncbi:hypothetical protein [Nonomuraea turkmeniaca]|uniref:hypothetical protein n=1 Tax=Nonomuraea turkmeniaca TaxID=103838 RepID=UPI0014774FD5|nr:hypothetical protein [Nonomuraea turkmeniaca]
MMAAWRGGWTTTHASRNAGTFVEGLRAHVEHGKPVAVTEFGTCAYRGAGERRHPLGAQGALPRHGR